MAHVGENTLTIYKKYITNMSNLLLNDLTMLYNKHNELNNKDGYFLNLIKVSKSFKEDAEQINYKFKDIKIIIDEKLIKNKKQMLWVKN